MFRRLHALSMRKLCYVYNSRTDFIDLWITTLILIMSIEMLVAHPIEVISTYHDILKAGASSKFLGITGLILSILNYLRIFYPRKPPIGLTVGLKCFNFGLCLFMFLSMLHNDVIPLSAILYGMVSLLIFDNIKRTR